MVSNVENDGRLVEFWNLTKLAERVSEKYSGQASEVLEIYSALSQSINCVFLWRKTSVIVELKFNKSKWISITSAVLLAINFNTMVIYLEGK